MVVYYKFFEVIGRWVIKLYVYDIDNVFEGVYISINVMYME